MPGFARLVWHAKRLERGAPGSFRDAKEAQKDLGGQERIAARGVTIVWRDVEGLAQRVEREAGCHPRFGECAIILEMKRQIHRVE